MKKIVAGITLGLLLATQTINVEAAAAGLYQGKVIHMEGEAQEIEEQTLGSAAVAKKKPTLRYKANLSVDAGLIGGITLTCKSTATNKSTGAAVAIDSIKTVAKIICKDGTSTSKSTTKKKASSCTCSFHKNFFKVDVQKYTGKHTFKNSGYKTATLNTSKTQK